MFPQPEAHEELIQCYIWSEFPAIAYEWAEDGSISVESKRAGGSYTATAEAIAKLTETITFRLPGAQRPATSLHRVLEDTRRRLSTWLVDQTLLGVIQPTVTVEIIETASRNARQTGLPVHERANRLLRLIAIETGNIGGWVGFDQTEEPNRVREINLKALAWSESSEWSEVEYLVRYLERNELLECDGTSVNRTLRCRVTVDGYNEIARLATEVDSTQAFVAMWFDDSMADAYDQGIEQGIRDAGYNPVIINRVEHVDLIDDAIVAAIRRSKFVVADFTQGNDGARGGVYYEAGFAHGLGIPVIFACRKDRFHLVHFDTNHRSHILWLDHEELRTKLQNRIEAVIGRGPVVFNDETQISNDDQSTD